MLIYSVLHLSQLHNLGSLSYFFDQAYQQNFAQIIKTNGVNRNTYFFTLLAKGLLEWKQRTINYKSLGSGLIMKTILDQKIIFNGN